MVGRGAWVIAALVVAAACGESSKPASGPGQGARAGSSGSAGSKAGMSASGGRQTGSSGSDGGGGTAGESGEGGSGDARGGEGAASASAGRAARGGAGGKGAGSSGNGGGESSEGGNDDSGTGGSAAGASGMSQAGAGGGNQCDGGEKPPTERRLPQPCVAPLPTGYCLVSEAGDWVLRGQSSQAEGDGTVALSRDFLEEVGVTLTHPSNGDLFSIYVAPITGEYFVPGLYEPVTSFPTSSTAGFAFIGGIGGCTSIDAKFSVEEFARDPSGITRLSFTFEQHCDGQPAALRGVVNLNARGTPDPTPAPDRTIPLSGNVFRVAHDPQANVAYGLDATNRRLSKIDLDGGMVTYADVLDTPNAACVDVARGRLFVVHQTSKTIGEYDTADLDLVRNIPWSPGRDYNGTAIQYKIFCAPDRLYVVDSTQNPGLFTVTGLDGSSPVVTDHSANVFGVGSIALSADDESLYYVQSSRGYVYSSIHRLLTSDLSETDTTGTLTDLHANPPDGPIILDEGRGLLFTRNKVYEASDLSTVVHTLPGYWALDYGALENAYALDTARGHLATKYYVYDLGQYDILKAAVVPEPDQVFFDAVCGLWFLSMKKSALMQQLIE